MELDQKLHLLETTTEIAYPVLAILEGVGIGSAGYSFLVSDLLGASKDTVNLSNILILLSLPTSLVVCQIIVKIDQKIAELKGKNEN